SAFAQQISGNSIAECRICNKMRAVRGDRRIAAQQLVDALRARLDTFEPVRNREVDRLVVAGFEMQEWHVFAGAPVSAEQGWFSGEIQRGRNRPPPAAGDDQKNGVSHACSDAAEEFARQIRPTPFPAPCTDIEFEELVPVAFGYAAPRQPIEFDFGRADGGPLFAQRLAPR